MTIVEWMAAHHFELTPHQARVLTELYEVRERTGRWPRFTFAFPRRGASARFHRLIGEYVRAAANEQGDRRD